MNSEQEVKKEDQDNISEFAYLSKLMNELKEEHKKLSEELQEVDDIESEAILSEDLRIQAGTQYCNKT